MSNFSKTTNSASSVTYVSDNPPIQIRIVGLINTICFQRAKRYASVMAQHLPTCYSPPEIMPFLEVEWNEYVLKLKRLYGGEYYKMKKPLLVYKDGELLGDDEDLVKFFKQFYQISILEDFEAEAIRHLKQYMEHNDRTYIHMTISIDDTYFGNIVFILYDDICPNTCANFLRLSTLKHRGYRHSLVHRICRESWVQFGGWNLKRSSEPLACENYAVPHDRRGVLSMCHNGKHSDNSTQFFVTLNPTPWMNSIYCAFGQLVIGDDVLTKIANVETFDECPLSKIKICESGIYSFYEVASPENEKLLKTIFQRNIRGSDYTDSRSNTPPTIKDPTIKKDLDNDLKRIARPVYRLPQTPYRLEDELLFTAFEAPLGDKAKSFVDKMKGSGNTVTSEGIVKPILTKLVNKVSEKKIIPTIHLKSVVDPRDVPSKLSISKYYEGMYDFVPK